MNAPSRAEEFGDSLHFRMTAQEKAPGRSMVLAQSKHRLKLVDIQHSIKFDQEHLDMMTYCSSRQNLSRSLPPQLENLVEDRKDRGIVYTIHGCEGA